MFYPVVVQKSLSKMSARLTAVEWEWGHLTIRWLFCSTTVVAAIEMYGEVKRFFLIRPPFHFITISILLKLLNLERVIPCCGILEVKFTDL